MFDVHELVMLDGKRYLMNMFGWEGAILDGKAQGVYSFAGINDVVAAMTQQSGELIDQITNIKGKDLRVNVAQLERVFSEWVELDVAWKTHKTIQSENQEVKQENMFMVFFLLFQAKVMVLSDATLGQLTDDLVKLCMQPEDKFSERYDLLVKGLAYLLALPDESVIPEAERYTQLARDCYKLWKTTDQHTELIPQFYRYGLYVWVLRRRAGLL
jgi:hypothetical protein